jgi:hypothetical protein
MALLHWIEDWTIVNELLVVWLVLLLPLSGSSSAADDPGVSDIFNTGHSCCERQVRVGPNADYAARSGSCLCSR